MGGNVFSGGKSISAHPLRVPARNQPEAFRVGSSGARERAEFSPGGGNGAGRASSDVAGMAGLEPTISESKSGVLPLHYIPSVLMN